MVLSRWVLQLVHTCANTAVIALENPETLRIILCFQYVVLLLKIESVYLAFAFAVIFQWKYLTKSSLLLKVWAHGFFCVIVVVSLFGVSFHHCFIVVVLLLL